jgi:hypothetical protein
MLRRALLFVAGLVALDVVTGAGLEALFTRTRAGEGSGAVNRVLEHANVDVVVFGSSRAKQHFDPAVLVGAAPGPTGYNAAANGQGVPYARAVQALIAAHRTADRPQCQVLHLDVVDLVEPRLDRVAVLLPLARRTPVILDLVARSDPWARVKALSSAWRFNSVALSVLRNQGTAPPEGYLGFDAKTARRRGMIDDRELVGTVTAAPDAPSPVAVALLRDFVATARAGGDDVVWVTSPMSRAVRFSDDPLRVWARDQLRDLSRDLGVTYLSFDEDAVGAFARADLFVDAAHLNAEGAELLSRLLAGRLRSCALGAR